MKLALLALICLLAGSLMAEVSLKLLYLVQLNSSDEVAISRGERGSDPCEALQLRRRKQREKIFHVCRYGAA
jgi:hypothetical protein